MDKYKTTMLGETAKEVMSNFKTKEDAIEALEVLISAFKNEEKIIKMFEDGIEELYERMSRTTGVSKHMVMNVINNHMCSIIFEDKRSPKNHSALFGGTYGENYNVIFADREEAETVLGQMLSIIADYGCCSVSDLYDLVGFTSDYTDLKVGWIDLKKVRVMRVRSGYTFKLPKPVTLK